MEMSNHKKHREHKESGDRELTAGWWALAAVAVSCVSWAAGYGLGQLCKLLEG